MSDIYGPDLTGSVWRINDSGTTFVVVNCQDQYAIVENMNPPARRRRILRSSLKTTRAKNGYTLVAGTSRTATRTRLVPMPDTGSPQPPPNTDSPAGLKQALWRSIKNAIKTPDMWPHEAADVATKVVDGPLDDLLVLVQVPKVRELAVMCMSILEGNFEFTPDRPEHDMYVTWRTALEADQ